MRCLRVWRTRRRNRKSSDGSTAPHDVAQKYSIFFRKTPEWLHIAYFCSIFDRFREKNQNILQKCVTSELLAPGSGSCATGPGNPGAWPLSFGHAPFFYAEDRETIKLTFRCETLIICFVFENFAYERFGSWVQKADRIDMITRSLREMNQAFFQTTRKCAEVHGITHIQFFVLKLLRKYPRIGLSELAAHMHASPSTISGVVDRLTQAELITRDRLEQDRRSLVIRLSPAGEELLARTEAMILERLSPLLEIPEDEIGHMLKVHQQIVHILKKIGEEN